MKESMYNVFLKKDPANPESSIIAFNGMTCSLAAMTPSEYEIFLNGRDNSFQNCDNAFLDQLMHGRFIIEDDCDEKQILKHNLLQNRYDTSTFSLTIAPTLGCNFDCIYCYETSHSDYSKMSQEIQDSLFEMVKRQVEDIRIRHFFVIWYGGEPLLALDVIEALTDRFLELCEKNGVEYGADIISNGYLLTRSVVERLTKLHLRRIQITIDGPEDIHDKRRMLTGGNPTFARIVKNIYENIDIIPKIALRINVDTANFDRVVEVKELFKAPIYYDKVYPYISPVDSVNDQYDEHKCLTMPEFMQVDDKFYNDISYQYPAPRLNACGADTFQSFVIAPDGAIYKCWDDIGIKEYIVDYITSQKFNYSKRYYDFMLYDPTEDPVCSNCEILPICMGACPNRRMTNSPLRCPQYKYDLERYIRATFKKYLNQADSK